jgi:hypothetical protein
MRRRRKPLEVSTFPFLAVLLCAMGSLILVLLVMDRKAKAGARAKALAKAAGQYACAAEEAERAAAARRAELERRMQNARAEWEKKREALHTKLLSEQQALQLQMQQLREKMALAAARLRAEQEQAGELKQQVAGGRERLQGETAALAAARQADADAGKRTEQEKAALARMTNDLVVLERALKDLKEAREREKQTYSVVPYRGKRGESRRPLYIECAGDRVIFHPDKKSLLVQVEKGEVLAEVERRVALQQQPGPGKPPTEQVPYLLMLVRPDGIEAYYAFQSALAGRVVNFGYELIDADWVLDFPADDERPGDQPWQRLAKLPDAAPPDAPKPGGPAVRGVQMGSPTLPPLPTGGANGPTVEGATGPPGRGGGFPGSHGDNPLSPGRPGVPGTAVGGGPGTDGPRRGGAPTDGPAELKLPWEAIASGSPLPSRPPRGFRGGNPDAPPGSPAAVVQGPPLAPLIGTNDATGGGGNRSGLGEASSGGPPVATGQRRTADVKPGTGQQAAASTGTVGPSPPAPPGAERRPGSPGSWAEGAPTGSAAGPGDPPSGPADREPPGGMRPSPTPGVERGPGSPAARAEGAPNSSAAGPGEAPSGPPEREAPGGVRPLPTPGGDPKRPPGLRAARLHGDRDYLIFVECRPDAVVLYPSQKEFPLAALKAGPNNPLVQAVQQMIERKQSGVRLGELPYRPQVRFLVRPESLQTYHLTYPLFDPLPVAKTRQNLIPEDDVLSIITGN